MTLITETVTINSKNYKHIYSDAGYYVKRNDNKLFMDVLEPTSSTYTYTETTQLATQQLLSRMMARMSTLEGLPHVVETYSNGTDWYRVYSDGWCIQGGYYDCQGTTYDLKTINFLKPFINTDYQVYITVYNEDCEIGLGSYHRDIHNKTTSSFQTYFDVNTQRKMWKACGYIN